MNNDLLAVSGLTVRYPNAANDTLSDVNLSLKRGEALGLVGESGSGKSTLARAICGLVELRSGSVKVAGQPIRKIGSSGHRPIQMVFQDPYASLNPHQTASQAVTEVFQYGRKMRMADARRSARNLLDRVGIDDSSSQRKPAELSGGQRQRVVIARALSAQPELLIADEPTSSLDVSVQARILELLRELCLEQGLALLFISHDLSVVRHMTTRTLVMYQGRIIEQADTESLFSQPAHPYTRILIDSLPGIDGPARLANNVAPTGGLPGGCPFAPHCPNLHDDCWQIDPPLVDDHVRCRYPLTPVER